MAVEWPAVAIAEHHPIGFIRIPGDPDQVPVMQPMMACTQTEKVPGVGRSALGPVDDVVDVDVAGVAAGDSAVLVAVFDDAPGAIRDDALCASDPERGVVAFPHRLNLAIAGEVVADRIRQHHTVGQLRSTAVGVEVEVGLEPFTALTRCAGE